MAIDIIDVMLAKKLAQGQAASILASAQGALQTATDDKDSIATLLSQAQEDAADIDEIAQALPNAMVRVDTTQSFTDAQKAKARENIGAITAADITLPDETTVTVASSDTTAVKAQTITVTKGSTTTSTTLDKNYTATGTNTDGSMTQKAITEEFEKIHSDLIGVQVAAGVFSSFDVPGINIDYSNRNVSRLISNVNFNRYLPFGGRKRCNVADNGTITAFEGDNNYTEDGSNGQVMVYQPKFYYLKAPTRTSVEENSLVVQEETIIISGEPKTGFSLHPLFLDSNNNEVDYVLLSAYEGCAYDVSASAYNLTDAATVNFTEDKLSSIANAKPISGENQALNCDAAMQLAQNRGTGWQLTNLLFESVNQLLMEVEYGSLNLQSAFNLGISKLTSYGGKNASCLTGSTAALGSASGRATTSIRTVEGTEFTMNTDGTCAISYRGVENPYGNMWRFIGGTKCVKNNGSYYIQFADNANVNHQLIFKVADASSWISAFGYDKNNVWANIPSKTVGASSSVPVGDYIYVPNGTHEQCVCVIGGHGALPDNGLRVGPFCYGLDQAYNSNFATYSCRLMHVPTANSTIHNNNVALWRSKVGSDFDD